MPAAKRPIRPVEDPFLDLNYFSEMYKRRPRTIQRWAAAGKFPPLRKIGNVEGMFKSEHDAYIEKTTPKPASTAPDFLRAS